MPIPDSTSDALASTSVNPTTPPHQKTSRRIIGLDIARACAIVGMVIVNFKYTMGAESSGPTWLRNFTALFDGRAAATFVVLAGIGASLGSRQARLDGGSAERRAAQLTLAKRGLFLFVAGWAFYLIWPADILHYYGVYLAVGSLVLFAPGKRLFQLAVAAIVVAFVFIVAFDPFRNWNLDDLSYRGIATPSGFVRNLFFDGFHPVFPWVAFYLFGMWLGRTDLRRVVWRRTLVRWSAIIVVATEALAWAVLGPKGAGLDELDDNDWRWLLSVEPIPPLPLYIVAGAATAVLVICGSIWLGDHLSPPVAEPLVSTGQLALTIYVAHVIIGMGVLESIGRLEHQSLGWAVSTALVFSAIAIAVSWAWRRRFERGPLEAVMRQVTR